MLIFFKLTVFDEIYNVNNPVIYKTFFQNLKKYFQIFEFHRLDIMEKKKKKKKTISSKKYSSFTSTFLVK